MAPAPLKWPHLARFRMDQLKKELEQAERMAESYKVRSPDLAAQAEETARKIKWRMKKKEQEILPHPALQWGPISQTVAIMSLISLVMSVSPLPPEMDYFYMLFSRLTICAVIALVSYTSIIYYGYKSALDQVPKPRTEWEKLLHKYQKAAERPDDWAHSRSHPSHFLTTRHAAPRLFPFPLGRTGGDGAIKDELWWEGGTAPHVGHFNKVAMNEPQGPNVTGLIERFKKSLEMERDDQRWKKRYQCMQVLCGVVLLSFVQKKLAAAVLLWLIYHTFSTEIEAMMAPAIDMDAVQKEIMDISRSGGGRNQTAPKPKGGLAGGMSYIYDPTDLSNARKANIPIHAVPPPVLLTTENSYYAGPGEIFKE